MYKVQYNIKAVRTSKDIFVTHINLKIKLVEIARAAQYYAMNINLFTYLNILKITVMIEKNKENKTIQIFIFILFPKTDERK